MHEVLVNRLGGLSLPRKSVVRLTDRPDMTLDVYRGRKTTIQQLLVFFRVISVSRFNYVCIKKSFANDSSAVCIQMDALTCSSVITTDA